MGKDAGNTDHLCIGVDSLHDLLQRKAYEEADNISSVALRRARDGIDDLRRITCPLQRSRDISQP